MKKSFLISLLVIFSTLVSCNNINNSNDLFSSINTSSFGGDLMDSNTNLDNSSDTSFFQHDSTLINDPAITLFDEINLFSHEKYNESYYLGDDIAALDFKYISANDKIVIGENGYIKARGVGKTILRLLYENYYKDIVVTVSDNDTNATSFKLDKSTLKNKKLVVFGDSVSAQATIGKGKTYSQLLEENMEMRERKNFAIGGTTLTYTYYGSNIYKEYYNSTTKKLVVDDAVTNVLNNIDDCKDADYIFIAYGHNDQYFQVPLDNDDNENDLLSLDNCKSYKASFRWIIRKIRSVNPMVRIIILNCTYSQYDLTKDTRYGTKYGYLDYRKANEEIATQFKCRLIDPWDYLKPYFNTKYYKDSVHLTELGQELLYKFLIKN